MRAADLAGCGGTDDALIALVIGGTQRTELVAHQLGEAGVVGRGLLFGRPPLERSEDSWRTDARRVLVVEKPRSGEVTFRPLGSPPAQPAQKWVKSGRTVELTHEPAPAQRGVDDAERHRKSIPRLRLSFALMLGVISIVSSVVLMCTDGIDAGVSWTHHAGVSTLFVIDAGVFAPSDAVGSLRSRAHGRQRAQLEPPGRVQAPEAGRAPCELSVSVDAWERRSASGSGMKRRHQSHVTTHLSTDALRATCALPLDDWGTPGWHAGPSVGETAVAV